MLCLGIGYDKIANLVSVAFRELNYQYFGPHPVFFLYRERIIGMSIKKAKSILCVPTL